MAKTSVLPFFCSLASSPLPIGTSLCAGLFAEPYQGTAWARARPYGPGGVLAMKQTVTDRASGLALFGPQLKKSPKIQRSPRARSIGEKTAQRQKKYWREG